MKVYLIGAGPGDPGLITVRGAECLARADAVLYDYLAAPALLDHAPPAAERICVGKHGDGKLWSQQEINAELIRRARAGQTVARLKGGDPTVFARLSEEAGALVAVGIPFEIVPGVTASIAAGAYAGIPLTDRDFSSAAAIVTGQEAPGKEESDLDFAELAKFPGTLVIYMGVTTAAAWAAELIGQGLEPATPAAIVRHCSRPTQQTIITSLEMIPSVMVGPPPMRPPAVVIIGEVVRRANDFNWFESRPLFGRSIVVTRPIGQADGLARPLSELGAEVIVHPAIEIGPPNDWSPVDEALDGLADFDWLVFSSTNGVEYLLERLIARGGDLRALGDIKLAAIGPATAAALQRYHLRADVTPGDFRAEALAAELAAQANGKRFLLARASRGREVLAEQIEAAGGEVHQVVVYSSTDCTSVDTALMNRLLAGEIDWITVTSSAIARSLAAAFGETLGRAKLASISPITSQTLRELGHEPAAEAEEYTMPGVAGAIQNAEK